MGILIVMLLSFIASAVLIIIEQRRMILHREKMLAEAIAQIAALKRKMR